MDGIQQNAPSTRQAGGRPLIISDDPGAFSGSIRKRRRRCMPGSDPASRSRAIRRALDTLNPAWTIGPRLVVGTLEPGKMADVVVWSGPFSVYFEGRAGLQRRLVGLRSERSRSRAAHRLRAGQVPAPGSDR